MGFQKHKSGMIVAVLCLIVIMAVIWFCVAYMDSGSNPEGTLVEWQGGLPEVIM